MVDGQGTEICLQERPSPSENALPSRRSNSVTATGMQAMAHHMLDHRYIGSGIFSFVALLQPLPESRRASLLCALRRHFFCREADSAHGIVDGWEDLRALLRPASIAKVTCNLSLLNHNLIVASSLSSIALRLVHCTHACMHHHLEH